MAKVKINTSGVISLVTQAFKSVGQEISLYVNIINYSVDRIQSRARLSKRMVKDSGEEKLPPLSKGYIKQREKLSPGDKGTDASFFRPNTKVSNLTYSGQLLKASKEKLRNKVQMLDACH